MSGMAPFTGILMVLLTMQYLWWVFIDTISDFWLSFNLDPVKSLSCSVQPFLKKHSKIHPLHYFIYDYRQIFPRSITPNIISNQTWRHPKQRKRWRWNTGFLIGGRAGNRAGLKERNHDGRISVTFFFHGFLLCFNFCDHKGDRQRQRWVNVSIIESGDQRLVRNCCQDNKLI